MKQIEYFFITEVNNSEKMRKILCRQEFDSFVRGRQWCFSTLVRKTSASIRLVFLIGNAIVKLLLETKEKGKNKHRRIILLAKSKLNSIEKIISKALIESDVSNDEFILVISGEQKFQAERKDQSIRRPAG